MPSPETTPAQAPTSAPDTPPHGPVDAGEVPLGRRERRKLEVRTRIYSVARELFAAQGFDATTVDEIAREADVVPATFFNPRITKDGPKYETAPFPVAGCLGLDFFRPFKVTLDGAGKRLILDPLK